MDAGVEAILITDPANRRYLSGFTGSAGTLIISHDRALLATDFRYYEQVKTQAPNFELVELQNDLADVLADVMGDLGIRRLAFESQNVTVAQFDQWRSALADDVELAATTGVVEALRAIKDEQELEDLRRAIELTDAAYAHIAEFIQPGMTERQIAWELEQFVRSRGADKLAFVTVAAGPNGAMPHAVPSERPVQIGDPIVMDMGALVNGYHADFTRTVALGRGGDKYQMIYNVVREAQKTALQAIRPGMTGREADALARDVIQKAGYGEFSGHSLGHGLGLMVHESPWVSHRPRGNSILEPGMVVTIEPGIYLPGEFGVRIEDVALLQKDGLQVLSKAAKEPVLERP
jgi:Xaa-Pro aminopeptidase